jgi:hypothetical protein
MRRSQQGLSHSLKVLCGLVLTVAVLIVALLLVRQRYVLSSVRLDAEIEKDIPPGSSKTQVIHFVQAEHPVAYDDMGLQIKARLSGLAENMIYKKDVILTFDFDSDGRLLSHTRNEYFTFF